MKRVLRNIFLGKYGLLILAVVLFSLSFAFNKLYTNPSSFVQEVRIAENYLQNQQRDFNSFLEDTSLVKNLISNNVSETEFDDFASKKYGIFLYRINASGNWGLAAWSNQLVVPPVETFAKPDDDYFLHLANGHYVVEKKTIDINGEPVLAFALILIHSGFFLETEYMQEQFAFSKTADKRMTLSDETTRYPVKNLNGKIAFYLNKKTFSSVPYNDRLTILLRLSAVFFLLLFIHRLAETAYEKKGIWVGVTVLGVLLLSLRVATYYYPSILNLRQFSLFDPSIYGSNIVQRSLGDLLINSVLFSWFILFAWSKLRSIDDPAKKLPLAVKWIVGIFSLCLLIGSTLLLATTIRSMVADSKISFDVTDFFSLNQYTVVGFIVLACLSLSYYYFTQLL